jgi:hypothetical protein
MSRAQVDVKNWLELRFLPVVLEVLGVAACINVFAVLPRQVLYMSLSDGVIWTACRSVANH